MPPIPWGVDTAQIVSIFCCSFIVVSYESVPLVETECALNCVFNVVGERTEEIMASDAFHIVDRSSMPFHASSTVMIRFPVSKDMIAA